MNVSAKIVLSSILIKLKNRVSRYFCDIERKKITDKIVDAPPSPAADSTVPFSVHMLVCKRDIQMSICSVKSLNLMLEQPLPWVFHDDGSLQNRDLQLLRYNFPGCAILERKFTDEKAKHALQHYPLLANARNRYIMMLKLIDIFLFSDKERIIYVDSDVLFFKKPVMLFRESRINLFNKDIDSCYLYSEQELSNMTHIVVLEKINAGLSALNREDIQLSKIEDLLAKIPLRSDLIYHRIEQTLVALLASASPNGVSHLDETYDVDLSKSLVSATSKHYVGAIRYNFELEGLNYLIEKCNFIDRWNKFVKTSYK